MERAAPDDQRVPLGEGGPVLAGHYALDAYAAEVTDAECAQITIDSKLTCLNLPERKARTADFQLCRW
ncbi:MAG: hypothetical protein WKG00_00420 [Polyangiaceae bacterium]